MVTAHTLNATDCSREMRRPPSSPPSSHLKVRRLVSIEHFSVDGTLIEAWA